MRRLHKFLHLTSGDRRLLASTVFLLTAIRLGLWILPFQTLRQILAKITPTTTDLQETDQASMSRVVWAIAVASGCMPGGVKCLARALATQVLLGRRGWRTQIRIGVAKGEGGQLEAHAWVESQGRIVIGGLKDLGRFSPLPALEVEKS